MSLLDSRRAELRRVRDAAAKDRKTIADLSAKIVAKQKELSRTKSASRARTLASDIERLDKTRSSAEKSLATKERRVADLSKKVEAGEAAEDKKAATAPARQYRETKRQVRETNARTIAVSDRVAVIENVLLQQVHAAIVADPVEREHDVFLSHTSEPADDEVSDELYWELTARDLDVWYDGAELRLASRWSDRSTGASPGRSVA